MATEFIFSQFQFNTFLYWLIEEITLVNGYFLPFMLGLSNNVKVYMVMYLICSDSIKKKRLTFDKM